MQVHILFPARPGWHLGLSAIQTLTLTQFGPDSNVSIWNWGSKSLYISVSLLLTFVGIFDIDMNVDIGWP